MMKRPRRLYSAFKAGFATTAALLLTTALFIAPFLSPHQSFAHLHPEGTIFHFHSIDAVLGAFDISPAFTLIVTSFIIIFLAFYQERLIKSAILFRQRSRAPPIN